MNKIRTWTAMSVLFLCQALLKHLPYVHCINIPTSHSASQENAIGGASTCLVELIAFDRPGG